MWGTNEEVAAVTLGNEDEVQMQRPETKVKGKGEIETKMTPPATCGCTGLKGGIMEDASQSSYKQTYHSVFSRDTVFLTSSISKSTDRSIPNLSTR